ncbi:MAG: MFS transporter [Hyphomicrobium sp.]
MSAPNLSQLLRYRAFSLLLLGRFLSTVAMLTQSVTLGWQVYSVARLEHSVQYSSFLVGMIGLVQFVPMFAFVLLAGETADRYDRRKILLACCTLQLICSASLALNAGMQHPSLIAIFSVAALFGVGRAFTMPASASLGPMLVPREILPRAIGWNTLAMQSGMILGPWLGGVLCATSVPAAYWAAALLYLCAGVAIWFIAANTKPVHQGGGRLKLIAEGLAYVWSNKIVFGAISLDLFAVLLGGVTALLPVFARDVLHIGPDGFGLLRSGPALGGGLMALALSTRPIQRDAGFWMLISVAAYGFATIIFAVSTWVWVSMLALAALGAADAVSVFVRQTLIQIVTPDPMRGRVTAVSSLFISASNELGEFESGVAARFLGPIGAAIFGGVGSIALTGIWAKLFPALRDAHLDTLRVEMPAKRTVDGSPS